eukprot:SAG25_NODE_1398_length_3121_cov_27.386168_1_plen_127_part_00
MMPCLTDWLGSAGSFYLKPPTGNLGTRTAIRTTVRPQLAHGRDSQSRPNLSYRRLEVLAKFRPLAARGSAQLLNLVQLYSWLGLLTFEKGRSLLGGPNSAFLAEAQVVKSTRQNSVAAGGDYSRSP